MYICTYSNIWGLDLATTRVAGTKGESSSETAAAQKPRCASSLVRG